MIPLGVEHPLKRLRGEGRSKNVITFSDKGLATVHNPNNDAVVMSMMVVKHDVKRILADS